MYYEEFEIEGDDDIAAKEPKIKDSESMDSFEKDMPEADNKEISQKKVII